MKGGNILLGITGGIAAYKMVEVASRLTKLGYKVDVVMTKGASQFITPLTFASITHRPVEVDLFTNSADYEVKHIALADRADLCLIGPATANFIGKMAHGLADDLLSTIVLATQAPVLIAPSMNVHMLDNVIVQENLSYLQSKGYKIIQPGSGLLACGYEGRGRLPEPAELVEHILYELSTKDFAGKKILITAGPTREPLDPVRFFSNGSSGKMGYALARAASYRGAKVTLVAGPTQLTPPLGLEAFIEVEKAKEMYREVIRLSDEQDIIIMTAAVADFAPASYQQQKIKKEKSAKELKLNLKRNPDILAELAQRKKAAQLLIGFAAETENLLAHARDKLKKKKLDLIVANDVSAPGVGFGSEENQVVLVSKTGEESLPRMTKKEIANLILDKIQQLL